MVTLYDSDTKAMYESAIAGAGAGAFTRAIAQPLDVLKIRFQLQIEPITQGSKYSSVLQAVTNIVKEEGISTLWSGHIPAQWLSITYGVIQFSLYEALTEQCQADPKFFETHKTKINFTNGAVAATAATVASFPFDTVRTRLIAEQKTHKAYKGFTNALVTMIEVEGAASLFKGLIPTIAQIAPQTGIQFAIYKLLTQNILNKMKLFQRQSREQSSPVGNLVAGSVAGFVAKALIYPFDVVKKRLQIQGFQEHRTAFGKQMYCNGLLHCIKLTVIDEGILALYKGFGPSMLKAALVSALHFAVYDELKLFLLQLQRR